MDEHVSGEIRSNLTGARIDRLDMQTRVKYLDAVTLDLADEYLLFMGMAVESIPVKGHYLMIELD